MNYAVVAMSGSQYLVKPDQTITIDKIDQAEGKTGTIDQVLLLVEDKKVSVGKPFVKNAQVDYQIVKNYQGKKLRIFKYKAKSRYRKTMGFRPQLTDIKITAISIKKSAKKVTAKPKIIKKAVSKKI